MKNDILLFLDTAISDSDLTFPDFYIPDFLNVKLKSGFEHIYYSIPESYSGRVKELGQVFIRIGIDDIIFWKDIFIKTGSDNIIKIFLDSPFIDPDIINEMLEQHLEYLAEFSYSENLPSGLSCEIISRELIESIPEPEKQTLQLSKVIRNNINQFDIELYYKDPDIRDKRISFRSGNRRDKMIMERLYNLSGSVPHYGELKDIFNASPEILYIGPSYIEIELTGRCDLDCIFCFRNTFKTEHDDIDEAVFRKILSDMREFNLPYNICLGGSGEPLLHSNFYLFMELISKESLVSEVLIETNGLYADMNFVTFINDMKNPLIKVIINVNGIDSESYTALHGKDLYSRVFENIKMLKDGMKDKDNLFLQIMKINETEPLLDKYYDIWEQHKVTIILQKQNMFLKRIEDRRYSDLSPIERIPCWHLQRDLYILSDGTITYCREDVDGIFSTGNVKEESIKLQWEKRKKMFADNYKGNLAHAPDCGECDEWYTFNL